MTVSKVSKIKTDKQIWTIKELTIRMCTIKEHEETDTNHLKINYNKFLFNIFFL